MLSSLIACLAPLAGAVRPVGCFQPQEGLHRELGRTNHGSVASRFSLHFVLYLLFPNMSAGEVKLFSSLLF